MKNVNNYFTGLSLLLCAVCASPCLAGNIIQNGSFENDCGGRSTINFCKFFTGGCIPPWEGAIGTSNVVSTQVPPDGENYLEMWSMKENSSFIEGEATRYNFSTGDIVFRHKYKLCFYVKNNNVPSSAGKIFLALSNDDIEDITDCGNPVPPSFNDAQVIYSHPVAFSDWTRVDVLFTANDDYQYLYIWSEAYSYTQVWAYFDHFVLLEEDEICDDLHCWTGNTTIPPLIDYRYKSMCAGSYAPLAFVQADFNGSTSTELYATDYIIFEPNFLANARSNASGARYFLAHIGGNGCIDCDKYPPYWLGESAERPSTILDTTHRNYHIDPNNARIFSLDGRLLRTLKIGKEEIINYRSLGLVHGIYIVTYYYDNEFIQSRKIFVD